MNVRVFIRIFIAAISVGQSASWAGLPEVIDQVRPSVVAVGAVYPPRQPNRKTDPVLYFGTGFAVGNGKQIITNAHVLPPQLDVEGNQRLVVFSGRGKQTRVHTARVVRKDEEHDVALLAIDGAPLPALMLDTDTQVREGQDVAFTGFPIGNVLGLYPTTHRAIVSSVTPIARSMENARDLTSAQLKRMRNPYNVYQLDAVAYPGNSGSPVYNTSNGKVIGVINAVLVKESREASLQRPSGISYAIPATFIQNLLQGS